MSGRRGTPTASELRVIALPLGDFTFPAGDAYEGQTGVVVGYAVRHPGGVFLFDTGFGFGEAELDDYYTIKARRLPEVLRNAGVDLAEVTAVANCHLHFDHSGQNNLFPEIPIYVQPEEWTAAHEPDYTIVDFIDFPGARYEQVAGDHEPVNGLRLYATPGHAPGHQSLVVDTPEGRILLAGQAVYSRGEWMGLRGAREGATAARDSAAYARSVARLRQLAPKRVLFGHDERGWPD
jgi:N-acyl homoserine lactone hydrolase